MLENNYNYSDYDFLDLGSKTGGSIEYCKKRFMIDRKPLKGIGLDLSESNVLAAREKGYDVIHADMLKFESDHKFKFVSALDFLEHLPGIDMAEKIIEKSASLATDFLFIRHPVFDDIEYLKHFGLKINWTTWTGHTAQMRVTDYCRIFNKLGLRLYCFNFRKKIESSDSKYILPIDAPDNAYEYSLEEHGPKPKVKFDKVLYGQIDIFVQLSPIKLKIWNWITRE